MPFRENRGVSWPKTGGELKSKTVIIVRKQLSFMRLHENQNRLTGRLCDFGSTGYEPSTAFLILFTNAEWTAATGDWDNDGEVDLSDAASVPDCLNGPDQFPDPQQVTSCEVDCLNGFDFESDLDVDLADFAAFQRTFGAP